MDELTGYFGRRGSKTLAHRIAEDEAVAKRGKPSLPKLKFMEGLGPEDPRFEPGTIIDDAGPVPDKVWEPFWEV